MTFTDDGLPIAGCGAVALDALTGIATCQTAYPRSGTHLIAATFNGTPNDSPSTSPTVGVRALVEAILSAIVVPIRAVTAVSPGSSRVGRLACSDSCSSCQRASGDAAGSRERAGAFTH